MRWVGTMTDVAMRWRAMASRTKSASNRPVTTTGLPVRRRPTAPCGPAWYSGPTTRCGPSPAMWWRAIESSRSSTVGVIWLGNSTALGLPVVPEV